MVVTDAEARNDLQLRKTLHERLAEQFGRGAAGDRPHVGMRGVESIGISCFRRLVHGADRVESFDDKRLQRADKNDFAIMSVHYHPHTNIVTGASINRLIAAKSSAP